MYQNMNYTKRVYVDISESTVQRLMSPEPHADRSPTLLFIIFSPYGIFLQVSVRTVSCRISTYMPDCWHRSQYSEGPAKGHLDTGFSWFPCVYKQMLRWFPRFQVATTCFSCSPPDLNLLVTNFIFHIHVK